MPNYRLRLHRGSSKSLKELRENIRRGYNMKRRTKMAFMESTTPIKRLSNVASFATDED